MDQGTDSWVVVLTTAMALTVTGISLLDSAVWCVQYGVLGLAVCLAVFAMLRVASRSATD
ncbi:hypothetical protein [Natrinema marinum]|uniref:hypothetical protein n=1 Tax=Natrinema marinum TaxID=2961598 RepID=UPI0020C933C1|nr:hypothetical protein [Natrinema marinum]